MNFLIIFASRDLIFLIALIAIIIFVIAKYEDKKTLLKIGVIAAPLAYLLAKITGHFYSNPRPFVSEAVKPLIEHVNDNGFPSEHTLLAVAIAAVIFTYNKRWGLVLGVLALVVGFARVAAGVHHSIDILGATIFSIVATYIAFWLAKKFLNKI